MKLALVLLISLLSVVLARPSADGVFESIKETWHTFKDSVSDAWISTRNWFKDKKDKAKAWLSGAITDTKEWFQSVKESVVKFYHEILKPFYDDIVETFKVIKDAYKYIKQRIESGFNKEQRAEVGQKLSEVFNFIAAKVDKYFYGALGYIKSFITHYGTYLGEQILIYLKSRISEPCHNNIKYAYELYNTSLTPKLKDCVKEVEDELVQGYSSIKDLFLGIPTTITDIVEDIALCYETKKTSCVRHAGVTVMNAAVGFVTDFISVKVMITSAVEKLAGARACITKAAKDTAKEKAIVQHKNQLKKHLLDCGLKAASDIVEYMSS